MPISSTDAANFLGQAADVLGQARQHLDDFESDDAVQGSVDDTNLATAAGELILQAQTLISNVVMALPSQVDAMTDAQLAPVDLALHQAQSAATQVDAAIASVGSFGLGAAVGQVILNRVNGAADSVSNFWGLFKGAGTPSSPGGSLSLTGWAVIAVVAIFAVWMVLK